MFCLLTDALIVWIGLNLATLTRLETLPSESLLLLQRDRLMCLLLYVVSGLAAGAFRGARLTDRFDSMYYAGIALLGAVVLAFLSVALLPRDFMTISRREIGLGMLFSAPMLALWRYFATSLATRFTALYRSFYVLGAAAEAKRIAKALVVNPDVPADAEYLSAQSRRSIAAQDAAQDEPRRDAIVCVTDKTSAEFLRLLEFCEAHCRRVFVYPSVYDTLLFQHSSLLAIGGVPLVEVAGREPQGAYVFVKRCIDIAVSLVGLLLAAPVCLVAAAAISATSPGGVFYTQERIGRRGQIFKIYKFRTMVSDAEARTGPVWAGKNDARVTPVGRFLRKHRIDEIPQLWNVLRGDMSLVGPRPERPHFHEEFSKALSLFDRRLAVRPGLTSLSHVLGSYSSDPADRLRYDLVYIGTLSLLNDLKIMFSTVRVVLGGKGAQ
ncbi:MAG TPA: sugar transferase [Candidatus Hydrogenedentes bacterium]|nr:sugar transferase [Candidatus Hydrogenedentota bacterium]HNT89455.1 sugar transferase [Candidatus Hydrogenedentota bacterium]